MYVSLSTAKYVQSIPHLQMCATDSHCRHGSDGSYCSYCHPNTYLKCWRQKPAKFCIRTKQVDDKTNTGPVNTRPALATQKTQFPPHRKHCVSITKTDREMTAVCFENLRNTHTHTHRASTQQNAEFLNVTYSYH